MSIKTFPVISFKPDLRSAKGAIIQRGIAIRILRVISLILLDSIAIYLAINIANFYGTPTTSPWANQVSLLLLNICICVGILAASGLYLAGNHRRNYPALIKAISQAELLVLLIAFLYEPNSYISRSSFLISWVTTIVLIFINRIIFDIATKLLRKQGVILYPVFLISDADEQEASIKLIQKEKCYTIFGITDSTALDESNRDKTFESLQKLGIVEAFVSWDAIKNKLYMCWQFQTAGITLRILPTQKETLPPKSVFWSLGEVPCLTIPAPIIAGTSFYFKRCFDLVCSTFLILLLSPVYITIALLIKLDSPGAILFKQERIGLHGKKFKMWKFRTMITDADKLQASLENNNETKDGILFKLKHDPRITRLGKFLRRYSLDELPQLFNVLIGEMSLVGPRPLPVRDVERFKKRHFIRQEVLPGITGLWQVSGRSNIDDFEDVVKLDINYIENWSLQLDLKILFKTAIVVLQKTGAY